MQVRHDLAGRTHHELPVPWSADVVTVEVQLRLPQVARRKNDFTLKFPHAEPITADAVRGESVGDHYRVVFRIPTPRVTVSGNLLWKHRLLTPVTIPVLTAEEFLNGLRIANPTLSVRLGGSFVAARFYATDCCRGILASAILHSPQRLAPVSELGLFAVFRGGLFGQIFEVPVPLTSEQRNATETMITAPCPRRVRRPGVWSVTWRVGNRELARKCLEAITTQSFEDSVRVADARFAVEDKAGIVQVVRLPPAPGKFVRVGPCFLIASGESGAVGICRLAVFAVAPGETIPLRLVEQDVVITDAQRYSLQDCSRLRTSPASVDSNCG